MTRWISWCGFWVVLFVVLFGGLLWAQPQGPGPLFSQQPNAQPPAAMAGYSGSGAELQPGQWKGGGGIGVLGGTPDHTALAMNGSLDYFVTPRASIGPLLQLGLTDDLALVGVSGQGKYWIDLPGTQNRGKLVLQSGLGFVHADFRRSDTSWMVPLGVGYDYTLNSGASLTSTMLLDFTNLHTGDGTGADVMPGFTFGVRF